MASVDLLRIRDTWANVRANLSNEKLAILSDDDETLVLGNGTDIKKLLVYSTWNGVVQSVVKTGTKIYTEGTTTGLANQQLDLALKELNDNKIEVDNGTATGILSVEDLEASGYIEASDYISVNGTVDVGKEVKSYSDATRSETVFTENTTHGGFINYNHGSNTFNFGALFSGLRYEAISIERSSTPTVTIKENLHVKPDGTNERLYVSDSRVQLNGTDGLSGFVFNTTGGADFYQDVNMGSGTELDTISGDFLIRRNTTSPSLKAGLLNIVGTAGDATLLLQYHDGTYRYSVNLTKEV